jgi:hypothetical protein
MRTFRLASFVKNDPLVPRGLVKWSRELDLKSLTAEAKRDVPCFQYPGEYVHELFI